MPLPDTRQRTEAQREEGGEGARTSEGLASAKSKVKGKVKSTVKDKVKGTVKQTTRSTRQSGQSAQIGAGHVCTWCKTPALDRYFEG